MEIHLNETNDTDLQYYFDNVTGEFNVWTYLRHHIGAQRLSLHVVIPLTILNVIIFISGLVGNISVCLVIVKHANLHTVTNYYLFNLAISDLTLLIFGLPYDVALYWYQYPWVLGNIFCKLRALISEWASYVSVLTIVAFSTERYFSICYPLYLYQIGGLRRALRIIAAIWIISFFAALPFSIYTQVEYLEIGAMRIEESAFCAMLRKDIILSQLSTTVFFLIPMVIIIIEYSMMGYKITNRLHFNLGDHIHNAERDRARTQSHKAIVRMLAVVVIAFFVCWAPFHAQRLIYIYGEQSPHYQTINEWMYFITGILYYFSSTLNPILYNVMSHRYRAAFREILCGVEPNASNSIVRHSTIRETGRIPLKGSKRGARNGHSNEVEGMLVQTCDIPLGKKTHMICELSYTLVKHNSESCI